MGIFRNRRPDATLERLVAAYLDVCNRAIDENVGEFWLKVGNRVNEVLWDEPTFRTIVYDQDPAYPLGEFMIHYDIDAERFHLVSPDGHDAAFSWKVPLHFLHDVVFTRPDWYVEHPMRLDWKWATARLRTAPLALGAGGIALGALLGALSLRYLRGGRGLRR